MKNRYRLEWVLSIFAVAVAIFLGTHMHGNKKCQSKCEPYQSKVGIDATECSCMDEDRQWIPHKKKTDSK